MLHCAHPSNLRSMSEHPNDLTLPLDLELFRFSSTLKSMFPASFQIRHAKPGDSGGAVPHRGEEPDAAHLVPFGPYGGGRITGHPIGLVIVIGLLLLGVLSRTPVALLLLASLLPGGICGLLLWLRHRKQRITEEGLTLLKL